MNDPRVLFSFVFDRKDPRDPPAPALLSSILVTGDERTDIEDHQSDEYEDVGLAGEAAIHQRKVEKGDSDGQPKPDRLETPDQRGKTDTRLLQNHVDAGASEARMHRGRLIHLEAEPCCSTGVVVGIVRLDAPVPHIQTYGSVL